DRRQSLGQRPSPRSGRRDHGASPPRRLLARDRRRRSGPRCPVRQARGDLRAVLDRRLLQVRGDRTRARHRPPTRHPPGRRRGGRQSPGGRPRGLGPGPCCRTATRRRGHSELDLRQWGWSVHRGDAMKRLLALLAVVLAAAACGGGGAQSEGPLTVPTTEPAVTSSTAPATPAAPDTTTSESTAPTVPATTSTTVTPATATITVYFLDESGRAAPVTRTTGESGVARAAVAALIDGPNRSESAAGLSTAFPADSLVLGIRVEDGTAYVDMSLEFAGGGGSASVLGRLAQLVYTLTEFDSIDRVRLLLDGEQIETFSGEGVDVSRPLARDDFTGAVPIGDERPSTGAPTWDQDDLPTVRLGDPDVYRVDRKSVV